MVRLKADTSRYCVLFGTRLAVVMPAQEGTER
jgi:hypothetical protein